MQNTTEQGAYLHVLCIYKCEIYALFTNVYCILLIGSAIVLHK